MKVLGYLCYAFAIIDFAGMFIGYDITGVSWSPIISGVVGQIFISIGGKREAVNITD